MLPWRRSDLYGPIFARASVASSIIVTVSALRFFFTVTLKRPWIVEDDIPAGRQAKKLPVVLSQEEVARFLGAVDNLKHRVILTVCYATGLRMTFTVWGDPATRYERMQVRVVGKGLPQVCSTPRKPISAPRCSGSAAMVRKVSDATRNRMCTPRSGEQGSNRWIQTMMIAWRRWSARQVARSRTLPRVLNCPECL